jgi:general L-amino acid transport system permease protein
MTVMTDIPDSPLARPRVKRTRARGIIAWLRTNLFATIPSTIITLLLLLVLGKGLISLVQWG